jgi:hypothetical protein
MMVRKRVQAEGNILIEVHSTGAGRRGALVFEVEGDKEEFDETLRAADQIVRLMARAAGKTPSELAINVLAELPVAANQNDDPELRRSMELAALYLVMHAPNRVHDRRIRNCSLSVSHDDVKVYVHYLAEHGR